MTIPPVCVYVTPMLRNSLPERAGRWWHLLTLNFPVFPEKGSRLLVGSLACLMVMIVGMVDYLTGYEIFFSVFYLLAIIPATWFGGRIWGFVLSILSVVVWILGDLAAGASRLHLLPFVIWWNGLIAMAFYSVLVVLVDKLHRFYTHLEQQVRDRTQALLDEMGKRERLEKEILNISEREQRRIGHDIHDTICQHLTGTALAAHVLHERLAAKSMPEARDAGVVTDLIEEGIGLTRDISRGLSPVDVQSDGIMTALGLFAVGCTRRYGVSCRFVADEAILIHDAAQAIHLYRIAQEAVTNAIKHSGATEIVVRLVRLNGDTVLTVSDNGKGLPPDYRTSRGMGVRIMEHRASMIGATFAIGAGPSGGTQVVCSTPEVASPEG